MFGQGLLRPAEILLAEEGECFKYVRHSEGFSFDSVDACHEFMVPQGCTPMSAGSFYMGNNGIILFREGSISLGLDPDVGDPKRLENLLGMVCSFQEKL